MFSPTSLAFFLPLVASISAVPTARQAPNYPPYSSSVNFNLIANVTDPACDFTPSIQGWTLIGYHVGAGEAFGVLQNPTPEPSNPDTGPGSVFYVNGTEEEVEYNQGTLVMHEGIYPAGFYVDPQNVTNEDGEHVVHIDIRPGEPGINIAQFPSPIPHLQGPEDGGYYACNNTLIYGAPAIQLLFKYYGESTPEGCVDVHLLTQCVTNATVDEFGDNIVNCYEDVASIDWTVYSA